MIAPPPSRSEIARRRRIVSTSVILGLAAIGLTGLTTSAFFTDNDTITSNGITTGSLDLTTDELLMVDSDDMAPGDSVFDEVTVTNSGSLAYRYALSYRASDVDTVPRTTSGLTDAVGESTRALLSSQLRLRVYANVTCTRAGTNAVSSDDLSTDPGVTAPTLLASVGNVRGDGALATEWAGLVGDAAAGGQVGDRELSSTDDETLCVRLDLSIDADNRYQDTSSEISLRFDAEQTTNNP